MATGIIDITLSLRESIAVYEGDPPFRLSPVMRVVQGDPDSFNTSLLCLGTHTGTHVDAPRHFDDARAGVDAIDLEVLCGRARVVDLRGRGRRIDEAVLSSCDLRGVDRLLLRTDSEGWADGPFDRDYTHLTAGAASWVRAQGIRLLGIDSPSVEGFDSPGMPVHHTLLTQSPAVVVVEGLDLESVDAGDYDLTCLPLNVVGGDGGPARAILRPALPSHAIDPP